METQFEDRHEAGKFLASKLSHLAGSDDLVILALPRGGVPVAQEIARELNAPLDVFIVRKLGVPAYEELAMGAIASGGVRVLNNEIIRRLRITPHVIDAVATQEARELERREQEYRRGLRPIDVEDKTVILVDDGLATGATMRAAVRALRQRGPKRILVAVPVGARETCEEFENEADEVVCGKAPEDLGAVGMWYQDFGQTTDKEVRDILEASRRESAHYSVASHSL